MLYEDLEAIYDKIKLEFYRRISEKLKDREGSLSATEMFSLEIIHTLVRPTIGEFAEFAGISLPGATYKVTSLIEKGYIKRVQSQTDKREYHLEFTDKYYGYAALDRDYLKKVTEKMNEVLTEQQLKELTEIISIVQSNMP